MQAITAFVHGHVTFGYQHAHHMKSAHDVYEQKTGVCRDFAHLALTFCRCMGIPARYCTGYMGDIGIPPDPEPMDFSGWFEVYLSGQWYTFDARHNHPRIGRVLIARGRDAADVYEDIRVHVPTDIRSGGHRFQGRAAKERANLLLTEIHRRQLSVTPIYRPE